MEDTSDVTSSTNPSTDRNQGLSSTSFDEKSMENTFIDEEELNVLIEEARQMCRICYIIDVRRHPPPPEESSALLYKYKISLLADETIRQRLEHDYSGDEDKVSYIEELHEYVDKLKITLLNSLSYFRELHKNQNFIVLKVEAQNKAFPKGYQRKIEYKISAPETAIDIETCPSQEQKALLKVLEQQEPLLRLVPLEDTRECTPVVKTHLKQNDTTSDLKDLKEEDFKPKLKSSAGPVPNTRKRKSTSNKELSKKFKRNPCIDVENENITQNDSSEILPKPKSTGSVVLGSNGTTISQECYQSIKWKSPATVTRNLLTLIFQEIVLATSSLSGNPSPAFRGRERPPKGQLNPLIVADIVEFVSSKFNIDKKLIRAVITTKCCDCAKKFKRNFATYFS